MELLVNELLFGGSLSMKTSLVYTYWTHILLTSICYFPSRKCLLLINEFIFTPFVHIVMTTIN